MRDLASWSISLRSWWGVGLRLHAFFLAFAAATLYLAHLAQLNGFVGAFRCAAATVLVLFLSVLAHEIGHALAALRVGGRVREIVIGPLGGLSQPIISHEPDCERLVAMAGPLVNALACLLVTPLLYASGVDLATLFHPLAPAIFSGDTWQQGLKLIFWVNWMLLLVNLLPAAPFDGGRILRSLLSNQFSFRAATRILGVGAQLVAVGLVAVAVLLGDTGSTALVPPWVPLVALAVVLYFSAQYESGRIEEVDPDDALLDYDFSQGYTSLDHHVEPAQPTVGPLRRRLEKWRQARRVRRRLQEQEEERMVDGILARLHESGMSALSAKERAILERVSARYRNRQQSS